ncbi:hypothetical protein [Laspinema palackyanum]|uniref:hypothetical protein n=1 Tax=Laspinema palackyanum TaxID=3231601 RepID=UPI00349F8B17
MEFRDNFGFHARPVCTDGDLILKHLCRSSYQLSPLHAIGISPFKPWLAAEFWRRLPTRFGVVAAIASEVTRQ